MARRGRSGHWTIRWARTHEQRKRDDDQRVRKEAQAQKGAQVHLQQARDELVGAYGVAQRPFRAALKLFALELVLVKGLRHAIAIALLVMVMAEDAKPRGAQPFHRGPFDGYRGLPRARPRRLTRIQVELHGAVGGRTLPRHAGSGGVIELKIEGRCRGALRVAFGIALLWLTGSVHCGV